MRNKTESIHKQSIHLTDGNKINDCYALKKLPVIFLKQLDLDFIASGLQKKSFDIKHM